MFDTTETGLTDTTARSDQARLDALCDRYDALIASGRTIPPAQAAEMIAMAGIFDLDVDQPVETLWPQLRTVLTAQNPRATAEPVSFAEADALTLMVVEDDPDMAQDLTRALVEAGHAVVGPFHSAEAAEVAAGLHAIDVALLDINLSGEVDGATLARGLRARWGIKIVFLSGDVSAAARHADVAEAMVIKPYRAADVLGALARVATSA